MTSGTCNVILHDECGLYSSICYFEVPDQEALDVARCKSMSQVYIGFRQRDLPSHTTACRIVNKEVHVICNNPLTTGPRSPTVGFHHSAIDAGTN